MSIEAISWALNLAPVPEDKPGKPNPACAAVLIGLANHAGPDGTAAFPSVHTLVRYTRLGERTVQAALKRLAESGVIKPCRPEIIAAHIARADQRPNGWDLGLAKVRTDLDELDIKALERLYPGVRARIAAAKNGVQSVRPADPGGPDGVQRLHLVTPNGVQPVQNGVQLMQERGATAAPEPYLEPSRNQESAQARPANENETAVSKPRSRGMRLPGDWEPGPELLDWAAENVPGLNVQWHTGNFRDYWTAAPGSRGVKLDWPATWRMWMRKERDRAAVTQQARVSFDEEKKRTTEATLARYEAMELSANA